MPEGYRLFVNDTRTILITMWPNGSTTVAMRPNQSAMWGPPVAMREED